MSRLLSIWAGGKTGERLTEPLFFPGVKNNAFREKIVKKLFSLSHKL